MKIRNGFVSNSSSSSFCLYGVCLEKHQLLGAYDDIPRDEGENPTDCTYEMCEAVASKYELTYTHDGECQVYYFGKGYSSAPDDMTFGEFRKSVKDATSKFTDQDPSHHVEEVY